MEYFIGCLIGIFTCAVVTTIYDCFRYGWGTLNIDHSNPEKDVYRIDIEDLDKLNKKKRIILKVKHNVDLSQK
jgi:hypothetical protein